MTYLEEVRAHEKALQAAYDAGKKDRTREVVAAIIGYLLGRKSSFLVRLVSLAFVAFLIVEVLTHWPLIVLVACLVIAYKIARKWWAKRPSKSEPYDENGWVA